MALTRGTAVSGHGLGGHSDLASAAVEWACAPRLQTVNLTGTTHPNRAEPLWDWTAFTSLTTVAIGATEVTLRCLAQVPTLLDVTLTGGPFTRPRLGLGRWRGRRGAHRSRSLTQRTPRTIRGPPTPPCVWTVPGDIRVTDANLDMVRPLRRLVLRNVSVYSGFSPLRPAWVGLKDGASCSLRATARSCRLVGELLSLSYALADRCMRHARRSATPVLAAATALVELELDSPRPARLVDAHLVEWIAECHHLQVLRLVGNAPYVTPPPPRRPYLCARSLWSKHDEPARARSGAQDPGDRDG